MTDNGRLFAFGIADIVLGVGIWLLFDAATVGVALALAGVAVLVVAAVRARRAEPVNPAAALRNLAADERRELGETAAAAENAEERPPATGG